MNKLKYIFQSSLILVFLSVLVQNNVAAEPTINIEQLFGFYANIVEKAQKFIKRYTWDEVGGKLLNVYNLFLKE